MLFGIVEQRKRKLFIRQRPLKKKVFKIQQAYIILII